jgi:predicted MFS family arabinose efflux permease
LQRGTDPVSRLSSADRKLLYPTWAAADGLGQLTLLCMPFMLGMLTTRLGFSAADAGLLISIEMCTLSAVCMAVSPMVGRLSKRMLATGGAAVAIAGNALSLLHLDFTGLAVSRAMAAVGYGLAMAAGNAAVTAADDSGRLYDSKMMLFAVTQLLVVVLVPFVLRHTGVQGFFVLLIAINALLLPLVWRLPREQQPAFRSHTPSAVATATVPAGAAIALTLCAVALYAFRESSCWTFVERLGAGLGVSGELVGLLIGIGTLPAILVPRLATVLRARFGDVMPTLGGILLGGVILYSIAATGSEGLFLALLILWPSTYFYSVPLLMAIAARIDGKGRAIAASAGALQVSFAAGPAVVGALVERFGPAALSQFILAMTVLMGVLMGFLALRLKKHVLLARNA